MSRTRIKICGVTRPEDAELAVGLGADFLGLNFFGGSPRCVAVPQAQEIAAAVAGRVRLVGVFVNATPTAVERISEDVGLDLLQFHGDESPAALEPFGGRAIKALRLEAPPAGSVLDLWPGVWGFLVEGRHATFYGGSGASWAYEMIKDLPRRKPVLLAGGLRPDNVGEALRLSGAWGVDVCSGIERSLGVKDESLMREFCSEVERADG